MKSKQYRDQWDKKKLLGLSHYDNDSKFFGLYFQFSQNLMVIKSLKDLAIKQ